jgi:hypothetical protein
MYNWTRQYIAIVTDAEMIEMTCDGYERGYNKHKRQSTHPDVAPFWIPRRFAIQPLIVKDDSCKGCPALNMLNIKISQVTEDRVMR